MARNPVLVLLALVVLGPTLVVSAGDPVVSEMIRMLEEGIDPDLVGEWLRQSRDRPDEISPDDLIALKRAGATDSLIRLALKSTTAAVEDTGTAGVKDRVDLVEVDLKLEYRPESVDPEITPYDLFVYLDGSPLAWAGGWSSSNVLKDKEREYTVSVPPGPHLIRVMLEKHTLKSSRKGTWKHEARAFIHPFSFDLGKGDDWRIELSVNEGGTLFGKSRPQVEFTVLRDGEVAERFSSGDRSAKNWKPLCGEAGTGRDLKGCVGWAELWREVPDPPDREAVRKELESLDYRPVPATRR